MPTADRPAISYTPGTWPAVVRSGTVVLLRPGTDPALLDSLWSLLARQPEVHEVLDAVTAASGASLSRLPWFGIVSQRGSLQVFLRGDIDLDVRLAGGETASLSGRDVTTWTERRFAAVDGFTVSAPDAALDAGTDAAPDAAPDAGLAGGAPALPLGEGVVLLRELHWSPAGAPAAVPDAGPASNAAGPAQVEEHLLAAAAADIAAEQDDDAGSAQTVLDFPDEGLDGAAGHEPAAAPAESGTAGPDDAAPGGPEAAGPEPADTPAPAPAPAEPAEQEPTSSYDHLWEQTVMRSIEDAAVREDPDADEQADAPVPGPADAGTPAEPPSSALPPSAPPAAQEPAPAPAPTAPAVPAGLIDSVPWRTGGDRPAPAAPPAPRTGSGPVAPPSLLAPPAMQQPGGPAARPAPAGPDDADHDGQTVMKSDLNGAGNPAGNAVGATSAAAAPPEGRTPATGPMVLARMCPQGHANPPTNAQCAFCGQGLQGDGVQIRRPRLGRMRLSTGELIDLDQSLIVGRQPSVSRVQGAVMPRLVQVASPSGDISRSHVEVRLEGWHVMLCDLKATNGTVLLREDQAPRRLAQGEMAILFDGDIADLGDGIQLRFEELL